MRASIRRIAQNYPVPMLWEISTLPIQAAGMYLQKPQLGRAHRIDFGKNARQYLLLHLPPKHIPQKNTWVVFYHGGGWHFGHPGMLPRLPDFFLQLGYPVVLPAYRLSPRYQFEHMREDLNLALLKTNDLMRDTGDGTQKIIAAGTSAGANLAAHLAFDTAVHRELGIASDRFNGFMSFAGPLDLSHLSDTFALRNFTGGKHGSKAFENANPIHRIANPATLPPALFVHGNADRIVPYASGYSFFEKYRQHAPAHFHTLHGKSHLDAVRWIHDDTETGRIVREWLSTQQFD